MASTQSPVKVPAHLQPFVVEQHYDRYTPINQAVWRYVMRQHVHNLESRAHELYLKGLEATGIDVERIPDVAHMNECLAKFGWGAVTISGVIPTGVFLDFQAHGLLPISADIRTLDHLAYTPAPDILHETAGHAPIIADARYAKFLKLFGELGAKAFSSQEDADLYEATRVLSIVKEDPAATPAQIAAAEAELHRAAAAVIDPSEATMVGRLYWWTVEYGLIGDLRAPKIYGAGLLSSMGESVLCLTDRIQKLPFDVETCIRTAFDITTYQPQLFVADSFDQLIEAVEGFKQRLAWKHGGTEGLRKAISAAHTATVAMSSGLQVTGTVAGIETDAVGSAVYFRTSGPTALAAGDRELEGHSVETHPEGFGSPIGWLVGASTALEDFTDAQLEAHGLVAGTETTLRFVSGVTVTGTVTGLRRHQDKLILVSFTDARVTLGDKVLFEPAWGAYDMAVGSSVSSVYAGAADKEKYFAHVYEPSKSQLPVHEMTAAEQRLQALYGEVRHLRESQPADSELEARLVAVAAALDAEFPRDWLCRLEALELLRSRALAPETQPGLEAGLVALRSDGEIADLIDNGLALLP